MLHADGNRIECLIWALIALIFLFRTFSFTDYRRSLCYTCAAAFFLFGLSDLVEVRTGAWYTPWWLLVWKIACAVVFITCFMVYLKRRKKVREAATSE
mgnify:CR=1 FL=1